MKKNNVVLTISYDGTDYFGFQTQKSGKSVADQILKALDKIEGKRVKLTCAGRTDSGVHAEGQVVNFFTEKISIKEQSWILALNSSLPKNIRVMKAAFADEAFDARSSAFAREYRYRITNAETVSALKERFTLHYRFPIDVELLNAYCKKITGEKDFTAFSASTDSSISKSRYVFFAGFYKKEDIIVFRIIANAFLHKMIRIIMGTFLRLQREGKSADEIEKIMRSKDRALAGPAISPKGLVFKKVYYKNIN